MLTFTDIFFSLPPNNTVTVTGIHSNSIHSPFEVSASFDHLSITQCRLGLLLASAFRLPAGLLYQVYQRVQFYLENVGPYRCNRNSAISERKSGRFAYTNRMYTAPPSDYF